YYSYYLVLLLLPLSSSLFPYTTLFRSSAAPAPPTPSAFILATSFLFSAIILFKIVIYNTSLVFLLKSTKRFKRAKAAPEAILSRSEEHTSELQSRFDIVCRLLLEKKKL